MAHCRISRGRGPSRSSSSRPSPKTPPVLVTEDSQSDIDAGRDLAARQLSFYETIPSYQRVIAREGVDNVAELAAVGGSDAVARRLKTYLDAGATDVVLSPLDRSESADREAVWAVAASP